MILVSDSVIMVVIVVVQLVAVVSTAKFVTSINSSSDIIMGELLVVVVSIKILSVTITEELS